VLLDLAGGTGASPEEQFRVLLHELGAYRPELLDRPRIVIGSRADVASEDVDKINNDNVELDVIVSAVTGEGLPQLVGKMADAVKAARDEQAPVETFVVHRPVAQGYRVEREDDGSFRVVGREAERAVALSDLTNPDALDEAHARLHRLGIDRALARAGASEGDLVHIGKVSFAYEM